MRGSFSMLMTVAAAMLAAAAIAAPPAVASDLDEFKVKRQEVFKFASPPKVVGERDRVEISFASEGWCDVSVAVERGDGRIVRHLVSGVLGDNAPAPLTPGSLAQTVVWDGKDDTGRYVDDRTDLRVRVSLGLKPVFEKNLDWSPYKRVARGSRPLICPAPDGVYVFEGEGCDFLRVYDHDGKYVRTIVPFPADKLDKVRGLKWAEFPQDGAKLPLKNGLAQATFLTSGANIHDGTMAKYQPGAEAMAVRNGRIALASERLNRLVTDGSSGQFDLNGPETGLKLTYRGDDEFVKPRSAAFSPDGKTLYLTGYHFKPDHPKPHTWLPVVMRIDFEAGKQIEPFVGSEDLSKSGTGDNQFRAPTSLDVDSSGRVYVTDYMNDRVQVFGPDGKLLNSIKTNKPTEISINQKTGEFYVAAWQMLNQWNKDQMVKDPVLTRFDPLDKGAKVAASFPLPLADHSSGVFMNRNGGFPYTMAVDGWAEKTTIWLLPGKLGSVEKLIMVRGSQDQSVSAAGIHLFREGQGKLEQVRDFGELVRQDVYRSKPAIHSRQKLYVNPANGKLYIFEGLAGVSKSTAELLEIDPTSGKIKPFSLPFDCEDLAFGVDGAIYMRTDNVVGRFNPASWHEIPFDYGEERKSVGFSSGRDGKQAALVSALILPAMRPGCFHQGGMGVSPTGSLVIACYNIAQAEKREEGGEIAAAAKIAEGRQYTPKMYPGRQRYNEVHVWDRHGQVVHEDAVPGAPMMDGIQIDRDDNIYMMVTPNRVLDGKPYLLERAETLVKAAPNAMRFLSAGKRVSVPLGESAPDRPLDLGHGGGAFWVEGQSWLYGGVGYGGFNSSKGGGGCACWHARFALDTYARSFAPEVDHFSVAVLDTNGNLITRIGRYGNVDSAGPDSRVPLGGDEVGLMDAAYTAVHSDHRLFIADGGNQRIASVKLDYHAGETVSLANLARAGN